MSRKFDRLRGEPVVATIERLEHRMDARFPDRGIRKVAAELADLVREVEAEAGSIRGRLSAIRTASRVLMVIIVVGVVAILLVATRDALSEQGPDNSLDWVPLLESMINDLIFAGLAVFFLYGFPDRLERGGLLALLHRLRSMAHVIDMHQLTKDPERVRPGFRPSPASAEVGLTRDEMEAYLDYCSELLSLVGKGAALCAEKSEDPLVLETVSRVETLTMGMSREIWAKIQLLPRPS